MGLSEDQNLWAKYIIWTIILLREQRYPENKEPQLKGRRLVRLFSMSLEEAASTIQLWALFHWNWAQAQEQSPRAHGRNHLISESDA